MKKILLYLSMGLMASIALSSCDKDSRRSLEEPMLEEKVQRPFNLEARCNISGMPVVELDEDFDAESLRATLKGEGYELAPTAIIKAEDFGIDKMALHWAVMGNGNHLRGKCANVVDDVSTVSSTNILPVLSITEKKEGERQKVQLSVPTRGVYMFGNLGLPDLQDAYSYNHYAFMALGGEVSLLSKNIGKLFFTDDEKFGGIFKIAWATDPNKRIRGIKKGEEDLLRHIPFMTDLRSVQIHSEGNEQKVDLVADFKPRGSLIGLRFVNKVERDIEIEEIIVEGNNSLNVDGYFDWSAKMKAKTPYNLNATAEKLPFKPLNEDQVHNYPVYRSETELRYPLPYIANITAEQKKELPCFYLWGFQEPSKLGKALKIKVKYHIPQTDPTAVRHSVTTKTITIDAPKTGFEDGVAYRLTVDLNIPYHRKPQSMLDLLAKTNMRSWGEVQGLQGNHMESQTYKLPDAVEILEGQVPGYTGGRVDRGEYLRYELGMEMPRRLTMARIFPTANDSIAYPSLLTWAKENVGNLYWDRLAKTNSWLKFKIIGMTPQVKTTAYQTVEYLDGKNTTAKIIYKRGIGQDNKVLTYALKYFVGHPDYVSAWRYSWVKNPQFIPLKNLPGDIVNEAATEGYAVRVQECQIKVNAIDDIPVKSFEDIAKEDFWNDSNNVIVERYFAATGTRRAANNVDGTVPPQFAKTYGRQGFYWLMDYPKVIQDPVSYQSFCLYFDEEVAVITKLGNGLLQKNPAIVDCTMQGLVVRPIKQTVDR